MSGSLGETILNHYEKFLGAYIGADKYADKSRGLQILGFDKVFENSLTFATFGLSNYAEEINALCEAVMTVDSDYDNCATLLANAAFYAVQNKIGFGMGVFIGGLDNVAEGFSKAHNKSALYFTEPYAFPDEFSRAGECKIFDAFFITEKEAEFIKQNGADAFEDALEKSGADVIALDRPSAV